MRVFGDFAFGDSSFCLPSGYPTLFIKSDFLSFLQYLDEKSYFRSARCSLGAKPPSDPGTANLSGTLVGLDCLDLVSGLGPYFSHLV